MPTVAQTVAVLTLEAHGKSVDIGLDHGDHISERIRKDRTFYELDLLEDVFSRDVKGTAIDVGAHIGNHSLWFAGICGFDVVALEPNPTSFVSLSANFSRNAIRARAVNIAAGEKRGRGTLQELRPGNSGMTEVVPGEGDVRITPIDRLGCQNVGLIKVDTEGAELDVLRGAFETIARDRPLIYVETTDNLEKVDGFLSLFDYRRFGQFCKTPTYGYVA